MRSSAVIPSRTLNFVQSHTLTNTNSMPVNQHPLGENGDILVEFPLT
jgi:hypothetical protein